MSEATTGNGSARPEGAAAAMNRHARRAAAATDKSPSAATVVTLGGRDYEIGRFNIGELKRMTEIVEKSDHAIDRSKLLLAINNSVEGSRHTHGQRIFLESNFPIGT